VPHVLASAKAWHDQGALLGISDVVTPPHWLDEAAAREQMSHFTRGSPSKLGPLTPLELRPMIKPEIDLGRPV
jgi:hypothetical protein